jgi:hypothetical protein
MIHQRVVVRPIPRLSSPLIEMLGNEYAAPGTIAIRAHSAGVGFASPEAAGSVLEPIRVGPFPSDENMNALLNLGLAPMGFYAHCHKPS